MCLLLIEQLEQREEQIKVGKKERNKGERGVKDQWRNGIGGAEQIKTMSHRNSPKLHILKKSSYLQILLSLSKIVKQLKR